MSGPQQQRIKVFVVGASLGRASLNNRLAAQTARAVERVGATADLATVGDFDCPF